MSDNTDAIEIVHTPGEGLHHGFRVRVAASDLESRLRLRVAELQPKMNLRGFRPGKVPVTHIRRMYGEGLMEEIINTIMQESGTKACKDAGFIPATEPKVTLTSDAKKVFGGTVDLEYEMQVEAVPEFESIDVSKLQLSRPVIAPDEAELQTRLEQLARGNASYHARDGREAIEGDAVLMDFVGRIDGTEFEGGSAEDQQIVLGSGSFIPGFEDGLIGAKAGEDKDISVTFPEDYGSEDLRGKAAVFSIKVKEVRESEIPSIDDEFAKALGLESLQQLKTALGSQLQADYAQRTRAIVKRRLFDQLGEAYDFDLPQGIVEGEFDEIWEHTKAEREDSDESEDEQRDEYQKLARKRVMLGLILAQLGREAKIDVKPQEMERAIKTEAARHYGREKEAEEFIRRNKAAMVRIRGPLFEEKVVDYILARAKMTEQEITPDALVELEKEDA